MSQGVFYAIRRADGTMSAPELADNKSTYIDDRANDTQLFKFKMPNGNVEVWAEFVGLRTLIIHQAPNGKISPLYGVDKETRDSNVVNNVALKPVKLKVTPKPGFKLLDVSIDNIIDKRLYHISDSMITVEMPRENDTVHVTPTFGLDYYNVTVTGDRTNVDVTLSNTKPKAREEVTATIVAKNGYIPYNISVQNAKNWWREGKPTKLPDGRWQVVYRIKVDLDDVTVKVGALKVYAFSITDTENSGRLETYIPEVIPDYPGLAAQGQQVPILVKLPDNYSSTFTAQNALGKPLKPVIYHNALRNSFADEGMASWTETKPGLDEGFPIKVFTDTQSEDNKYWGTSVKNSMSQSVTLAGREFPAHAKSKDGNQELLSVAALVSINPRLARKAEAYVVSSGGGAADSVLVADYGSTQEEGWQTVFKTVKVNAKADKLKLRVHAEGDDQNKKRSYEGPQFDDLCLLLPAARDTLWNEDVLVFTMGNSPVTISCVPTAHLDTLRVDQQEHATVTLINKGSGQQGDPITAVQNDVIVIKGQYDPDYAIYGMTCNHYKKEPSNPNVKADEASDNANASSTYSGWIDLFAYGTSGWNSGVAKYQPWTGSLSDDVYLIESYWSQYFHFGDLTGEYAYADWGVYNQIGEYAPGTWRTPTHDEWIYIVSQRPNADSLRGIGMIDGVPGFILLPDNSRWDSLPFNPGLIEIADMNWSIVSNNTIDYAINPYTSAQWEDMERAGAIFLPAAGDKTQDNWISVYTTHRDPNTHTDVFKQSGDYMSSTFIEHAINAGTPGVKVLDFDPYNWIMNMGFLICNCVSVRLIRDCRTCNPQNDLPTPITAPVSAEPQKAKIILQDNTIYILLPDGTRYDATGKKVK